MSDEKLFASFLNRLFNTLNWTITEFAVAIKEMQEHSDLRQVCVFQRFGFCNESPVPGLCCVLRLEGSSSGCIDHLVISLQFA